MPPVLGGRSIFRSGLHFRHWDLGSSCFTHQSPVALKAGTSDALQREHSDSGTACSAHQSSCEPGVACAGAWPEGLAAAVIGPGDLFCVTGSLLSQAPLVKVRNASGMNSDVRMGTVSFALNTVVARAAGCRNATGLARRPDQVR